MGIQTLAEAPGVPRGNKGESVRRGKRRGDGVHCGFGRSTIMASVEDRHFLPSCFLFFIYFFFFLDAMGLWATTWALTLLLIAHDNLNGANGIG